MPRTLLHKGLALLPFLFRHWFLLSLGTCLLAGYLLSHPLQFLQEQSWLRTSIVFSVLLAMALPVPLQNVQNSLKKPLAPSLATLINLLAIPLAAWTCSFWLPSALGGGLCVASVVPSTMASAAVWTKRAGGDESIPILVTLASSLLAVLVAPLWLSLMLGQATPLPTAKMIIDLALTVLLPILLAKSLTLVPSINLWALRHQRGLGLYCQLGILSMITIGAIQLGQGSLTHGSHPLYSTLLMVLITLGLHLAALATAYTLAHRLGLPRAQKIGVALAASQKTLMIGLKLAVDCGVSVLPMVVYHIGQLLLDAVLVERWKRHSISVDQPLPPNSPPPSSSQSYPQ